MNPFTRLKPVRQKKKTLSPILVPACQHITGEWVSHVTSSLRDCEGQARCAETGSRTERRTERKVKGRWKKGEQRETGGMGCYCIIGPMSLYFPLIICGPRSLQSLNHTSPEDSEGTWEGPSQPDKRLKAILITVTVSKYGDFGGAGRDKRERKQSCGRITAKFAHCQTSPSASGIACEPLPYRHVLT